MFSDSRGYFWDNQDRPVREDFSFSSSHLNWDILEKGALSNFMVVRSEEDPGFVFLNEVPSDS